MDNLWNDIRFGLRAIRSNPATSFAALLALALGIGATTAIFSVVNGVLFAPLPYPRAEQIVVVFESSPQNQLPRFSTAPSNFFDWRDQNHVFDALAATSPGNMNLTGGGGDPEVVAAGRVSGDFWDLVNGKRPMALGRGFGAEEDRPGHGQVAVLSNGFWQRRFGSDKNILGRSLTLDGQSYTVVGVAPKDIDIPGKRDLWVPLGLDPSVVERGQHTLLVFGRMKPGVTLAKAQTEMSAIAARIEQANLSSNKDWGVLLVPMKEVMVEKIRQILLVLFGAVGAVLLIACLNVANLLLARLAARDRELALRTALGAGRARLIRQVLTESVVLGIVGGILGVILAYWGTKLLVSINAKSIPRSDNIHLDAKVLLFTFGISILSGLLFGLLPALSSSGHGLLESLKEGGRAVAGGVRGRFARQLLVLFEVAIALVLLVLSGLFIRSFSRLSQIDPGFDPKGVLTMQISPPADKYPDEGRQIVFFHELLERVHALPGAPQAATSMPLPLAGGNMLLAYAVEGRPIPNPSQSPSASIYVVTPDYFRTMGIHLRKGRVFTPQDDVKTPLVTIVNEAMAKEVWPGEDAIGKRLTYDVPVTDQSVYATVVGVVADVKQQALSTEAPATAYWAQYQRPFPSATLVVKASGGGDPLKLVKPIRNEISAIDRELPVYKVQTMQDVVDASLAQSKLTTVLFALFAGLALILASVGVYGVVSYSVTQRTHEIGIRMALGAHRKDVLNMVVRQGMTIALLGVVAGLVAAFFATKLVTGMIYGVTAKDPLTFLLVPLALLAVAVLANYLPARKATRVDPLVALRAE